MFRLVSYWQYSKIRAGVAKLKFSLGGSIEGGVAGRTECRTVQRPGPRRGNERWLAGGGLGLGL